MTDLYGFSANSLEGKPVKLDAFRGKVALVVNTASQCSFTPQYAELEQLQQTYHAKGFYVLGFPCNQFGKQEPGGAAEIRSFCRKNYGVTFPMFDKIDVNGASAHPLYKWLTSTAPGFLGTPAIKWNFTKFLIDRDGNVVRRYAPTDKPEKLAGDIEAVLG